VYNVKGEEEELDSSLSDLQVWNHHDFIELCRPACNDTTSSQDRDVENNYMRKHLS
jgi:hypothetical protein